MNQIEKLEREFLKHHTAQDILKPVTEELNEFSCKFGTVFYGNGEAILSPEDTNLDEETLFVDRYGDRLVVVRG